MTHYTFCLRFRLQAAEIKVVPLTSADSPPPFPSPFPCQCPCRRCPFLSLAVPLCLGLKGPPRLFLSSCRPVNCFFCHDCKYFVLPCREMNCRDASELKIMKIKIRIGVSGGSQHALGTRSGEFF